MSSIEALGYFGVLLTIGTYSMKRMVPLRATGICANCVFIAYGCLSPSYPQMLLHAALLPLNAFRLIQMIRRVEEVRRASRGDEAVEALLPFASRRHARGGDVIFRLGERASGLFYTLAGRYRLEEIGLEVGPGLLIGEMGLIAADQKRSLTFACLESGELLVVDYEQVQQLLLKDPRFACHLLRLIGHRLLNGVPLGHPTDRLRPRVP
jgi:hypothetical protein